MGEVVSVYDCMDDLTAIPTVDASVGRTEAELAGRVDVMLAASTELKRLKRHLRQDIVVVEQGVDPTHFATSAECPPDLERLPRPRLTFVGGVDERLDFQLLEGIARLRPGWSIVLIGPELYVRVKQRVGAPNVYRLGYRAYECLPAYLQNTDVCLVPYADSAWARACNPVKVPEYLAAGRPVIATDLPALRAFAPYVRIVRGPEAFVAAAEALMATDDASARAARRARVREETWATRAAAVLAVGAAARQRTSTTSAFETVAVGER
jgi:UDP-galactopyranose mutase